MRAESLEWGGKNIMKFCRGNFAASSRWDEWMTSLSRNSTPRYCKNSPHGSGMNGYLSKNIQNSIRVWMIDAYPVNPEAATPLQPKWSYWGASSGLRSLLAKWRKRPSIWWMVAVVRQWCVKSMIHQCHLPKRSWRRSSGRMFLSWCQRYATSSSCIVTLVAGWMTWRWWRGITWPWQMVCLTSIICHKRQHSSRKMNWQRHWCRLLWRFWKNMISSFLSWGTSGGKTATTIKLRSC